MNLFFSHVATPLRLRESALLLDGSIPSSISDPRPPYSLSPCHFITSVLPTKHLFDPSGP
jgi:hypothetical protein